MLDVQSGILNKSCCCIFTQVKSFSAEGVVGNLNELVFSTGWGLDLSVWLCVDACACLR